MWLHTFRWNTLHSPSGYSRYHNPEDLDLNIHRRENLIPLFCCSHINEGICLQVTKIIINKRTKKVKGVEYFKDGEYKTIKVRKEVILSAGAVQSPQILMLSGIGPKKHLQQVGTCNSQLIGNCPFTLPVYLK